MRSRISLLRANRKRVRDAAMFFVAAELSRRNFRIERVWDESGADLKVASRRANSRLATRRSKSIVISEAAFTNPRCRAIFSSRPEIAPASLDDG